MSVIRASKQRVKRVLDNKIGKEEYSLDDISDKTKVVSFDVFDTLIVRDVNRPTDVFRIMEETLGIPGFYEKRIEAEQAARRNKPDTTEVNIYEIYRGYEGISSENANEYIEKELQTEISLCHPNSDIIPLFEKCKEKYRVIIASDMYLPADMMEKLLKSCSITGYEKIYVSCDVEKSKYNGGELFDFISDDLGININEITHIGDDFKSDYMNARKKRIQTMKIRKQKANRLISRYKLPSYKNYEQVDIIYNYISNTTPRENDFYYRFGYENFGVLLWGFCKWLLDRMTKEGIEQALFIARDGYIIKEVYDMMGCSKIIPSYYFEMSRRSSIVATSLSQDLSYEEMLCKISLPARLNINQLFDAWGLEIEAYEHIIKECKIDRNKIYWLSFLEKEEELHTLYDIIKDDIKDNARKEYDLFMEYIDSFHFERKTALVDIGWAGTIQKQIIKALKNADHSFDLRGYYLALDKRSRENAEKGVFIAEGYIWDHYNSIDNSLEEGLFVGLFESLFLEKDGSIKKYEKKDGKVTTVRYPYEYLLPGMITDEIGAVSQLQQGAISFVKSFQSRFYCLSINMSSYQAFRFLRDCLVEPSREMIYRFGEFRFYDMGDYTFLAKPKMNLFEYMFHPKQFVADFYESQWPLGFFKALIKADISYERLWLFLRKFVKKRHRPGGL